MNFTRKRGELITKCYGEGVVSSMKVRGSWSSEIQASPIEDAGVKLR